MKKNKQWIFVLIVAGLTISLTGGSNRTDMQFCYLNKLDASAFIIVL